MVDHKKFNVGLVQMSTSTDPDENLAKAVEKTREAADLGARVICHQELFRSRYFCQTEDAAIFDLAEEIPGPSTKALGKVARETKTVVVASLFERRTAGLYHNTVAILGTDGEIIGKYRKMHIPDDPSYYEKFYFTPGDLGFKSFDTDYGRLSSLICWDQWYPEGARLAALSGAMLLFYPTAIGWHPSEKDKHGAAQRDAWRTVQRGHAISNGIYVAAVNRTGFEPSPAGDGIEFWGSSFICDPQGVVIAEASADKEEILLAEIDLAKVEEIRRNWPFLRDRRIDAYGGIEQRFLDS